MYTAPSTGQTREPNQTVAGTLKIRELDAANEAICHERPKVWKGIQLVMVPLVKGPSPAATAHESITGSRHHGEHK